MYVDMDFITKTNKNNQKELRELNVVDSGLMWRGDVTKDYYSALETCLCSLVLLIIHRYLLCTFRKHFK